MSTHESFKDYHGNKGDDEGAPKPLRDLNNGEHHRFIPIEEVPDHELGPEDKLIADEEGGYDEREGQLLERIEEQERISAQRNSQREGQQYRDAGPLEMDMKPGPEYDAQVVGQSGGSEPKKAPYDIDMKRYFGRSTGPRGREPKHKNKRRAV